MKKAIGILGIVLALTVLLGLLVPVFVDANQFRPDIESRLSSATGKKFKLGALNLSLAPPVTLKVSDVFIESAMLPLGSHLMTIPQLELRIAPWSYLQGKVEIESITLKNPKLLVSPSLVQESPVSHKPEGFSSKPEDSTAVKVGRILIEGMSIHAFQESGNPFAPNLMLDNIGITIPEYDSRNPFTLDTARANINLQGARLAVDLLRVPIEFSSGSAEVAGNRFSLSGFQARLGDVAIDGQASADPLTKPTVKFQLHFPELSAEKIQSYLYQRELPLQKADAGKGVEPSSDPTHVSKIEGIVTVDRFLFGSYTVEKIRADVALAGNELQIKNLQGRFCEGVLETHGKMHLEGGKPVYNLASKIRGAKLASLLRDKEKNREFVTGLLDADLNVSGIGLTPQNSQDFENLRASGRFSVGQGSFQTLNLLEQVSFLSLIPGPKANNGNLTPFLSLRSDFRFDGQRVTTERMEMQTGPLAWVLSGSFTPQGDLDYLATTSSTAAASGDSLVGAILGAVARNVNISFRIRGNIMRPEILPAR